MVTVEAEELLSEGGVAESGRSAKSMSTRNVVLETGRRANTAKLKTRRGTRNDGLLVRVIGNVSARPPEPDQ